jgi:Protein of unknown function (DUF2281)
LGFNGNFKNVFSQNEEGERVMTIETEILNNVEKLPESVKKAVFLYTEFLASQYAEAKTNEIEAKSKKRRLAGSMKGTFILPLPDNFDEPLEEFADYM